MRYLLFALASLPFFTLTALADHAECPSTIYYANGQLLKNGSAFWYESGQVLKNGSALWYPSGQILKNGSALWYENGQVLKNGSALWYENGQILKNGSAYWYANGQVLKNGSVFWYDNGQIAKNGSTLWRRNGSRTSFPITLEEEGPGGVFVSARLSREDHDVRTYFPNSLFESSLVEGTMHLRQGEPRFEFFINTGVQGENVRLRVGQEITCSLITGEPGRRNFTLESEAVHLDVRVKDGYEPERVRRALERTLERIDHDNGRPSHH